MSRETHPTPDDVPTVGDAEDVGDAAPDAAETDSTACVLWHRRDLRVADNPAVTYATHEYDTVCPLFVFDPHFYTDGSLVCDARRRFLHESLDDLREQYAERGVDLVLAHGDPETVLGQFVDRAWDVVTTAEPTGRYGRRRDDRLADRFGVTFVDGDGLRRGVDDPRENWSDHVETYFETDTVAPDESGFGDHGVGSRVGTSDITAYYDVSSEKTGVPKGGRRAGLARLDRFVDVIRSYPSSISSPTAAETGTSRLSGYLRFGCLSVREVYQRVQRDAPDGRGQSMFVSRLYWNRHYNQKLEDWPGWMDTAVNPVFRAFNRSNYDADLVDAWKRGETGFPMVDASTRCLRETGWLNFRMRAMCASFFGYILEQPWQVGADWFYYHLVDADPAINYTQWQMQTGVTGVHSMRIYNPRKQVRDNDPDGEFVYRFVPELRDLPAEYLDHPEKTPLHVQSECGVEIGDDYPRPVVDYEAKRQSAQERFGRLRERASEALEDPEIRRRASFSRRGGPEPDADGDEGDAGQGDGDSDQATLGSFE